MRLSVSGLVLIGGLGSAAALLSATALSQGSAPGPVRYAMDAATMSGFGAMMGGGSGGGLGAMMGMMGGGAPKPVRTLDHFTHFVAQLFCQGLLGEFGSKAYVAQRQLLQ